MRGLKAESLKQDLKSRGAGLHNGTTSTASTCVDSVRGVACGVVCYDVGDAAPADRLSGTSAPAPRLKLSGAGTHEGDADAAMRAGAGALMGVACAEEALACVLLGNPQLFLLGLLANIERPLCVSAVISPPMLSTRCISESMYSLSVSFSLAICWFAAFVWATLALISSRARWRLRISVSSSLRFAASDAVKSPLGAAFSAPSNLPNARASSSKSVFDGLSVCIASVSMCDAGFSVLTSLP